MLHSNPPTSRKQRTAVLWIGITLLLIFALTRYIELAVFPPFLDEIIHVEWAERSVRNPFLYIGQSRLLTVWTQMLVQSYTANTVWVMRAIAVLTVLPGFAAVLALGRLFGGVRGMLLAGLLAVFSTYHFFFERLALGDPLAASLVLVGMLFAAQLWHRRRWQDAVLTGLALFTAILAKASILPFIGIPLAAVVALSPERSLQRVNWVAQLRWLAAALGVSLGLLGGLAIFARLVGQDFFMLFSAHNRGVTSISELVLGNARDNAAIIAEYWGQPLLLAALLGMVVLLLRRQFFLPLCFGGPLLILWLNETQFTRFFLASFAVLLLCGAVALTQTIAAIPRPRLRHGVFLLAVLVIVVWGMGRALPFAVTAFRDPAALPLATRDYDEYVRYDSSGFGLAEILTTIRAQQGTREVIGLLSNCIALRALAEGHPFINCPTIKLSQQGIDELAALVESKRGQSGILVAWEPYPFVPTTIPGNAIIHIARPANGTPLILYRLE